MIAVFYWSLSRMKKEVKKTLLPASLVIKIRRLLRDGP